jgi:uncharacterized membrane-anchored protein
MSYAIPWLPGVVLLGIVLALLIVPGLALIALTVVLIAAVAALVALVAAIVAAPYLLARSLRRRRRSRSVTSEEPAEGRAAKASWSRRLLRSES